MNKLLPWILLLVAVLFILSGQAALKVLKNELAELERDYKEMKSISDTTIMLKDKEIEKNESKIAELNGYIDSSNTVIVGLENKIEVKDDELEKIRQSWGALSLECKAELNELDAKWISTFSLAQDEIAELKKQIKIADEREILRQGQIVDLRAIIDEKDRIISGCEAARADIVRACLKDKQRAGLKAKTSFLLGVIAGFGVGKI